MGQGIMIIIMLIWPRTFYTRAPYSNLSLSECQREPQLAPFITTFGLDPVLFHQKIHSRIAPESGRNEGHNFFLAPFLTDRLARPVATSKSQLSPLLLNPHLVVVLSQPTSYSLNTSPLNPSSANYQVHSLINRKNGCSRREEVLYGHARTFPSSVIPRISMTPTSQSTSRCQCHRRSSIHLNGYPTVNPETFRCFNGIARAWEGRC